MSRDYSRIIEVLESARRPLSAFEFRETVMDMSTDGLHHVGCQEPTLARRMREAAALGILVCEQVKAQNGRWYSRYSLPKSLQDALGQAFDAQARP